jgi:hypothetical protein
MSEWSRLIYDGRSLPELGTGKPSIRPHDASSMHSQSRAASVPRGPHWNARAATKFDSKSETFMENVPGWTKIWLVCPQKGNGLRRTTFGCERYRVRLDYRGSFVAVLIPTNFNNLTRGTD